MGKRNFFEFFWNFGSRTHIPHALNLHLGGETLNFTRGRMFKPAKTCHHLQNLHFCPADACSPRAEHAPRRGNWNFGMWGEIFCVANMWLGGEIGILTRGCRFSTKINISAGLRSIFEWKKGDFFDFFQILPRGGGFESV